jgi:hypothetical protein
MADYLAARVYGFWEGSGSAFTNPVVSRRIAPEMFRFEWLAGQWAFSDEERRLVRAHFAFLMYLFASENYYAGDASMLPVDSPDALDPTLAGMANQNFYTDVINVYGTGAQVFWAHPRAPHWRRLFIERWQRQLEYHMYPESGLWEESHTYYHHVLHTVLPTFLRRRADGVDDPFAHVPFQKLVGAEIPQLTPRDAFFEGGRHVVIFGDHSIELRRHRYLFYVMAEAFAPHNPSLAENLAWAYREMLGQKPVAVAPKAPVLRNEYVQGLGVMFRGTDANGQESLMALRSGNAWGHHHNDDGSLQFYAKGRAMLVDAGFGGVSMGRRKFEAGGHSRWGLKHLEAVNCLWRFNRGWISKSELEGPLAFATACSPIFMVRAGADPARMLRRPVQHFRSVVQINPATYLVVDVADTDHDQMVAFHIPGEGNVTPDDMGARASFDGDCRLAVQSLTAQRPPHLVMDHPKNPQHSAFVTTALEYNLGRESISAFLLIAEHAGSPNTAEITRLDQSWGICGAGFDVVLKTDQSGRVTVASADGCISRTLVDAWKKS